MQKSKDITKYDIHWQIVRVQAKKYKDISSKINYVLEFYSNYKTLDNHERILNWLEGLAMGYKNPHDKAKVLGTKVLFDTDHAIKEPFLNPDQIQEYTFKEAEKYNHVLIKDCFNDNFIRFRKWASEGYIHEELYEFTYGLLRYLIKHKVPIGRTNITLEMMADMHLHGSITQNTYKFKFK